MTKIAHIAKKTPQKEVAVGRTPGGPTHALAPFEEMDRMFDRLFEHFVPRGWLRPGLWDLPAWGELGTGVEARLPRVDVLDRDEEILIRAELPGVDKKDLDVSMTDTAVTIRGTTHHEEKEEAGDYYRSEISRGEYLRTVALPAAVDGDRAKAAFQDGVLELTLPKVEVAKRRTIKVE